MARVTQFGAGNSYPDLWSRLAPDSYEIVELSGGTHDVVAYAAAMAIAQEEYPGHFGYRQRTLKDADDLLNFPDTTTYAVRNVAGAVLGAISVQTVAGNARFEFLLRLKSIRDQAIGKRLFLRGLQHAAMQGAKRISLDVMAHNQARQLYEELGFEPYDDDYLDWNGGRNSDVISMELCGEQAISDAHDHLYRIIEQQLIPDLQQQSA